MLVATAARRRSCNRSGGTRHHPAGPGLTGRLRPGTDRCTVTVGCSDYSVLLLIGPLVRACRRRRPGHDPDQAPPGRSCADAARRGGRPRHRANRDHGGRPLASQRLFTDRWLCCVWEGNSQVGDELSLQTYLQLGHVVYSTAARLPGATVDTYLARAALPRRSSHRAELPARADPAAGNRPDHDGARASGPAASADGGRPSARAAAPVPPLIQALWSSPHRTTDPALAWSGRRSVRSPPT